MLPLAIIPRHDIEGRCCWLRGTRAHRVCYQCKCLGVVPGCPASCSTSHNEAIDLRASLHYSGGPRRQGARSPGRVAPTEPHSRARRASGRHPPSPPSTTTTPSSFSTFMARTPSNTPTADSQSRRPTSESRRATIDALFARQSSQVPSSSPPRSSQGENKLKLSGPRTKRPISLHTPPSRTRASLPRSRATLSRLENTRGAPHPSQTPVPYH